MMIKSLEMRQYDEALGKRIVLTRLAQSRSAKEVAEAIGVSKSRLCHYEAGRCSCPPAKVARIAQFLGVSVTALMPKFRAPLPAEDAKSLMYVNSSPLDLKNG